MPSDETRVRHYQRERMESLRLAEKCAKRGDVRGARAWLAQAESEGEAAAFWSSESAPVAPAFAIGA